MRTSVASPIVRWKSLERQGASDHEAKRVRRERGEHSDGGRYRWSSWFFGGDCCGVKHLTAQMRNIRGGLHNFEEVYPDEGEMDFGEVMRVLRDVQFAGAICPDHLPRHAGDAGGLQAFAFGYGYIKALIQAVNSEVRG